MFNVPISRQQGGSELNIGPTAKIEHQAGASHNYSAAGPSTTLITFTTGASVPGFYTGKDAPTLVANPGSVYVRTSGSMSGLYTNISGDTPGSSWRGFQQGSAIG